LRFSATGAIRTFVVLLPLTTILGCEKDEIRHYQVSRLEIPPEAQAASVPTRMLTAILPQRDRTWFFKLTGPPEEVEKYKDEFEHFIQSVRFTKKGDPPVTYTVPPGWERQPGDAMRFATFRFGDKEKPLELSVVHLDGQAGSLPANIKRWRDQLGLPPMDENKMIEHTREMEVDGVKATIVELTGTMTVKAKKNAPFAMRRPLKREPEKQEPDAQLPLTYQTPPGWKEQPARDGISLAIFQILEGDRKALVTISTAGGSATANVNRWRAQVGLEPVSEEQIQKDIRPIDVSGSQGQYADLTGPESAGGSRILAVMVPREGITWFFKMRGPADIVGRQKSAFETFVRSVRFTGK
jgi:hypothetical protein